MTQLSQMLGQYPKGHTLDTGCGYLILCAVISLDKTLYLYCLSLQR